MAQVDQYKINVLEQSLEFQKEFTYIDIIQDQLSKLKKVKRLKIHSKISAPVNLKNKKVTHQICSSRSQIRKKSRTLEKQTSKQKNVTRKSIQKKFETCNKKTYKTLELKAKEVKTKSTKSLKSLNFKKTIKDEPLKKQDLSAKKKKEKSDQPLKIFKNVKPKRLESGCKDKKPKTKNSKSFQDIPFSAIQKKSNFDFKQSNIMHDYFGIEDKLSSIVQQKHHTKNKSSSSKCKTQSSSSSISIKKIKFQAKEKKK